MMARMTESQYKLSKTAREIPDEELRKRLRKIYLRLNGDGTLTLMPGSEPIDPRGLTVPEISEKVRFLLPSYVPMLDDKTINDLVRTAMGRRGKQTRLVDTWT